MASTTSVISLFICLLATYCYSVPVGREYDISTSRNEFSTGKFMTEHDSMAMVTPSEQTTVHSMMHHRGMGDGHEMYDATTAFPVEQTTVYPKRGLVEDSFTTLANEFTSAAMPKRESKDDESDEATTERQFSKGGKYQTRGLVEDSFTTMANEFTSEAMPKRHNKDSESDEVTTERQWMTTAGHGKRGDADDMTYTTTEFTATSDRPHHARAFEHDSFTTMESSTQFNGHATRNEEDKHEGHFSGMDMSTIESTSSIDSFGKATGLLQNEQTEQKPMTSKFESDNRVVKTETIIPGKITETKIYSGIPSRTLVVDEPMTTESSRLSQGETMFHNAEIKSNH